MEKKNLTIHFSGIIIALIILWFILEVSPKGMPLWIRYHGIEACLSFISAGLVSLFFDLRFNGQGFKAFTFIFLAFILLECGQYLGIIQGKAVRGDVMGYAWGLIIGVPFFLLGWKGES